MDSVILDSIVKYALAPFLGALGAYLAIREDLAMLKARAAAHDKEIEEAKTRAEAAHMRIDRVMEK